MKSAYNVRCPICFAESDYDTKREADARARELSRRANTHSLNPMTTHSQPPAAGKLHEMMLSHSTTSFDRFYKNPTPVGALDLAISDAIHGKQSQGFYSELVKARDLLNSHAELLADNARLRGALEEAVPHLDMRADALHSESLECTGKTSLDLRATSEMVRAISRKASEALRNEVRT